MPTRRAQLTDAEQIEREKERRECDGCGKMLSKSRWHYHKNVKKCGQPATNAAVATSQKRTHDAVFGKDGSAHRSPKQLRLTGEPNTLPTADASVEDFSEPQQVNGLQSRVPNFAERDPETASDMADSDEHHDSPTAMEASTSAAHHDFDQTSILPEPLHPGTPQADTPDEFSDGAPEDGSGNSDGDPPARFPPDPVAPGNRVVDDIEQDEHTEEPTTIHLEDLKCAQEFIDALRGASLDKSDLHPDLLKRLREPIQKELEIDDPMLRWCIDLYLGDNSEAEYARMCTAQERFSGQKTYSHAKIKAIIREMTGIHPIYHDMCIKGCLAFVGPFAKYLRCPKCGEARYDDHQLTTQGKKVPRQQFVTNPIGPQIQAAYRSRESAYGMSYRARCTREVLRKYHAGEATTEWTDYIDGTEYLQAAVAGDIDENSTVLMGSLDGAQLYRMKKSDCWVYIWVLMDRDPKQRYKKKHVLIGGVIPGPDKPGNIDSFLFPGLYHVSALMNDGLVVWDAYRKVTFVSRPFLAFMTADGPGMTEINGLVGHSGAHGCRLYCTMKGRHKPDVGHYYPVCLRPDNYTVEGCMHEDISLANVTSPELQNTASERYEQNLKIVLESRTQVAYRQSRLKTGISKPSLISGLRPDRIFSIPGCFPGDLMHLCALNIPDLLISLWRGDLACDTGMGDDKSTWHWAVLRDSVLWRKHGEHVAAARPYLPGSFDRPPRNPAEKLTSGYKAMEFLIYIYGLGPGLLYGVLPMPYWKNFCKLVRGVRIVHQKAINQDELTEADTLLMEFCIEFERLYYQRNPARIHFVRQSIHALSHITSETTRIGPYAGVTQWTMENTIGNLGREIRQPSKPYANLAQRAVRRCHVNAMTAMLPDLNPPPPLPRGSDDLGNGYVLLCKHENMPRTVSPAEAGVLREFVERSGMEASQAWLRKPAVARWARLLLPAGQIARSLWKEEGMDFDHIRMSRNVSRDGAEDFAQIRYFFKLPIRGQERAFAMVDFYNPPDVFLLRESSRTLWSCTLQTNDCGLQIIEVTDIQTAVAMVPHPPLDDPSLGDFTNRVFVVEKIGMDVLKLAGIVVEEYGEDEG